MSEITSAPYDSIQTESVRLGDLLRGCRFVIPSFQRPYDWGPKQWEQTLTDLLNHHSRQRSHPGDWPMGTISLERTSQPDCFVVADGQQRLTTISVMLAALSRVADQANIADVSAADFLYTKRLTPQGDALVPRIRDQSDQGRGTLSHLCESPDPGEMGASRVENAYRYFVEAWQQFLTDHSDKELVALRYTLLSCFQFGRTISSTGTGLQIFSLANNRGKPLDDADLSKAVVIGECVSPGDTEAAAIGWRSAVAAMAVAGVPGKRAIQYWTASDLSETGSPVRATEAKSLISKAAKMAAGAGAVAPLTAKFNDYAEAYAKSRAGKAPDGRLVPALQNIVGTPMLAQHKQLHALIPAARHLAASDFDRLAGDIESTMVVLATVKAYPPDTEKLVARLLVDLRATKTLADQNGVKLMGELKAFRDSLAQEFADAVTNATEEELPTRCAATLLRYVEGHMENLVSGRARGVLSINNAVEHILPQRLTEESIAEYGDEQAARYDRYRLGNLALIEGPLNSKASNRPFSAKVREYYPNTTMRLLRCLSMPLGNQANKLQPLEQWFPVVTAWTPKELEQRSEGIHRVLCEVLNVAYLAPGPVRRAELETEIPQADTPELLLAVVAALGGGQQSADDVAVVLGVDGRQGGYYLQAAKIAGLAENSDGPWCLTQEGLCIRESDNPGDRLRELIAELPLMVRYSGLESDEEKLVYIGSAHLAEATAKRRKRTLDKWLEYVEAEYA